jgi:hypothetical protein
MRPTASSYFVSLRLRKVSEIKNFKLRKNVETVLCAAVGTATHQRGLEIHAVYIRCVDVLENNERSAETLRARLAVFLIFNVTSVRKKMFN